MLDFGFFTSKIFIITVVIIILIICIYCIFLKKGKKLRKSKKNYNDDLINSSIELNDPEYLQNLKIIEDLVEQKHIDNVLKSKTPILKYYRTGGIEKIDFRLEVYEDQTFALFEKNEFKRDGYLDNPRFDKIIFLLQNVDKLKSNYCSQKGFDLIYHNIETDKKNINFGSFHKNCIPNDIYHCLMVLDRLIY